MTDNKNIFEALVATIVVGFIFGTWQNSVYAGLFAAEVTFIAYRFRYGE